MGMRSVAKETVFVLAPQGATAPPDEPEPEPELVPELVPEAVPDAVPEEVPEVDPEVVAPEVEPLMPVGGGLSALLQPKPREIEAMVAKERIVEVARCMKTVLSP
jgi:hypothetical protein